MRVWQRHSATVDRLFKAAITGLRRCGVPYFGAYLLLALWMTWPLAGRIAGSVPQGTESVGTVPLLNTWTLWWNADRASRFFLGYWDAPIFYPEADTFAFSEPLTTSVVVAPLLWLSGNRLLAYNAFLLLSLALNGWAGFLLLRHWRIGRRCAALGGAMIVCLPFVQNELGVLQLVPLFGLLATIGCLSYLARRPGLGPAASLGVMSAATYLTCANYGLFASVLLLAAGPWLLGRRLLQWQTWLLLLIAAAIASALTAPLVLTQLRVARTHGLVRSPELVKRLAADAKDYLVVPRPHRWEPAVSWQQRQLSSKRLSPGLLLSSLALIGLGLGLARRRSRPQTAFCAALASVALLLSLGPNLRLGAWSPYEVLWNGYPGFAQVRSPFRMAVFVQLATVLLASGGLHALLRRIAQLHPGWRVVVGRCLIAAVVVAAFVEIAPTSQALYSPPPLAQHSGWIDWLIQNTDTDSVIVSLPLPTSGQVRDYQETTLSMYWSTFHGRRLVNGYSGFLPEEYVRTKRQMTSFPDNDALDRLRRHRVNYCIVSRSSFTRAAIESHPTAKEALVWSYGDDRAGVDIYRLEARTPAGQ